MWQAESLRLKPIAARIDALFVATRPRFVYNGQ
jgi:hypothetical protein